MAVASTSDYASANYLENLGASGEEPVRLALDG